MRGDVGRRSDGSHRERDHRCQQRRPIGGRIYCLFSRELSHQIDWLIAWFQASATVEFGRSYCTLCDDYSTSAFRGGLNGGRNTLILEERWTVSNEVWSSIFYSAVQRAQIWDRWQHGESMSSIGRRFDRELSLVFSVIFPTGGIRPAQRTRPKPALSLGQREEISKGLSVRQSFACDCPSTWPCAFHDSPEVKTQWRVRSVSCGGLGSGGLGFSLAPQTEEAGLLPGPEPHSINRAAAKWSPEQIAGSLRRVYRRGAKPGAGGRVYRSLYMQARGV